MRDWLLLIVLVLFTVGSVTALVVSASANREPCHDIGGGPKTGRDVIHGRTFDCWHGVAREVRPNG